jgi:UDPglucose--hexose-1-phosphate uridylyltransferase
MIGKTIEEALYYAKAHLYLNDEDEVYLRNLLLALTGESKPYEGEIDRKHIEALEVPDEIVEGFKSRFMEQGLDEGAAERKAVLAMGMLTPLPSAVDAVFASLMEVDPRKATDYLYDLSVKNYYFAKTKVDKNLRWDASFKDGSLIEMSINLSKPEKDNKDIAKLVKAPVSADYPKCFLCKENLGYEGHDKHPARENIRFVPVTLDGGTWYLQYSPYGYFDRHCIVFYEKHVPMAMNGHIFRCLFDFVDQFPHFFIGSNSDLPIVGGSILNHEHFQGGGHLLPLLKAPIKEEIKTGLKRTKAGIADFYDTAIRLEGEDKEEIISAAERILSKWRSYDDPECDIIAKDEAGQHSTCTPLLCKKGKTYSFTMILRNNRCDDRYPDGIFHAHPEYFHIKKEGIGLIEAAGLFILPARLLRQGKEVEEVVKEGLSEKEYLAKYPDLKDFGRMIDEMKATGETAYEYMNLVCREILKNVAVYKDDEKGREHLHRFLSACEL